MVLWLKCAVLLIGLSQAPAQPPLPSVDSILSKLDDLYRSKASVARMELSVSTPRTTRVLRIKSWTQGTQRALIVIESPAREAGIATLRVEKNLWNYLPKVARTIRVPASMMLGSWMGTDFTNDDLVRESSYRDDFVASLVGPTEAPKGWHLSLNVKPGAVGRWNRLEIWVDEASLPTRMEYFDRKGRLARVMTFEDVKQLGGRRIPTRMVLTPTDTEGQRTQMRYLEIQFDVDLPEETFSLGRLEQAR